MTNSIATEWDEIHLPTFLAASTVFFQGVRFLFYPFGLMKTRMQVGAAGQEYKNVRHAFRFIINESGVRGLYRGLAVTSAGIIPAQLAYIGTLEGVRTHLPVQDLSLRYFVAGACASLVSTTVAVPLDLVTQRLMVQDSKTPRYKGSLDAFRTIAREDGFRGLWRGYAATLFTYLPSNGIWWSIYATLRPRLQQLIGHEHSHQSGAQFKLCGREMIVNAVCGGFAGLTAAIITNPLDVAKTRIQVNVPANASIHMHSVRSGMLGELVWLVKNEGTRALFRGCVARCSSAVPTSMLMITAFESVKTISRRNSAHDHAP